MEKCIGSLLYHSVSFCPCSCFVFTCAFGADSFGKLGNVMGRVCHLLDLHGNHLSGRHCEPLYNLSKPFCSDTSHGAQRQDMMFRSSFGPTWDKPSKSRRIAASGGNNIICQFLKITSAPTKQRQKNDNPHG